MASAKRDKTAIQEPPAPQRQGTMDMTAQEGIEYLKNSKKDALLKAQGLVPTPTKQGTMVATATEGEAILDQLGGKPEEKTRTQQKEKEEEPKPANLQKGTTMIATVKEAKQLLNDEQLGETRSDTATMRKAVETPPVPKRTITMEETSKEAQGILQGEQLAETRGTTAAVKNAEEESKPPPKRAKLPRKA